jgi:DNA invertase Pin-like site-specific DNA recombinase
MITKRLKELESAKARLAHLERSLAEDLQQELASLPVAYGFESVKSFLAAVVAAVSGSRRGRKTTKATARKAAKGKRPATRGKRRRAVITDATRAEVKKLTEGGKTGQEVAKALKISLPSVQNIKKALGLVKSRK